VTDVAQTKTSRKQRLSTKEQWWGAVQQHESADFFKKMKKGAEPLLYNTTPAKGPTTNIGTDTPYRSVSNAALLFDLAVFMLLQPERMKAFIKSNCVVHYRHFTNVCQEKITTERIVMTSVPLDRSCSCSLRSIRETGARRVNQSTTRQQVPINRP